jgi:hypothetical protein
MNSASEKGSDFIQDLGDAVRNNPVSAALIGMGVLWLFAGSRPVQRAGDLVRNTGWDRIPDAAGNAFDATRTTLGSAADAVAERVTSAGDTMRDGAVDAARYGRDYANTASEYFTSIPGTGAEIFDTARSNLSNVFKAQPLALGAIGIAIGAGFAATLPATQLETDTAEFAAEQTDRVTAVAENVVEAVTEEARKQGLTLEGAKSAAGDISAKVGRVVDAAGKGISERVTSKS